MQIKGQIRKKDRLTVTVIGQTRTSDIDPMLSYGYALQSAYNNGTITTTTFEGDRFNDQLLSTITLGADGYYWYQLVLLPLSLVDAEAYGFEYYLDETSIYKQIEGVWEEIPSSELIVVPDELMVSRTVWTDNTISQNFATLLQQKPALLGPTVGNNATPQAYDPYTLIQAARSAAAINAYTKAQTYIDKAQEAITLLS